MDNIFAEAFEKNENPVFTEKRRRKGKTADVEAAPEVSGDEGAGRSDTGVKIDDGDTEKREDV